MPAEGGKPSGNGIANRPVVIFTFGKMLIYLK